MRSTPCVVQCRLQASAISPPFTINLRVETINSGLASPGKAAYANLNVPPAGIPLLSTVIDTFGGTSIGSLWTIAQQLQGSITETGGSLNLAPNANSGSSQLVLTSARPYTLTGSAALVKVKQVVSSGSIDNKLVLQVDGSNGLEWSFQDGSLRAVYTSKNVRTTVAQITYDGIQHAWWRIREASGTVYWDTSPDGATWTARGSVATSSLFSLALLYAELYAETWDTGFPTPGTAKYANFNYSRYFVVSGVTSPTTAGAARTVSVEVRDALGNRATDYRGTVAFTSSDPQATLPANYTFTATDNGSYTASATFRTAGTQSITAVDLAGGSASGTQSGIDVKPASAVALAVSGVPANVVAGSSNQMTITAFDPYGNVATSYLGTIHLSSSDASASLPPDHPFLGTDLRTTTVSGVILRTSGTQSISAADALTPSMAATQSGILVSGGTATTLTVSGVPSPVVAGRPGADDQSRLARARPANFRGPVTRSFPSPRKPPRGFFGDQGQGSERRGPNGTPSAESSRLPYRSQR